MRHALVLLTLLAFGPTAEAGLSQPTQAVYLQFGGGLGSGDQPFRAGVGWNVGFGGIIGRYDDAFSIGRHIGLGLQVRQDIQLHAIAPELRTAPMFELRRGIDLLVVGLRASVMGGPLLHTFTGPLPNTAAVSIPRTRLAGGTVRVAGTAQYRFKRAWSAFVRLEAGADFVETVQPSLGFTLGLEWAVVTKQRETKQRK